MEQFKDVNRRKSKPKEKLNIAMFGQKRIPSREGGVEIVVEELCTRMVAQGHNVTCYNRGGHHVSGSEYDSKRLKEYKGIKLKTVPTIEKKGLAAVSSSFFAALCCAFGKYDVVHIHAEGPAFFAWLPKMFGKKVIVTIHGLDWQREKWKGGFGSKFIHQGEKNAVKYADEIIVLSKGVQDYFEKTYGRKTVFIPNGVSNHIEREPQIIKNKFGLGKDEYILFLGRLVPEKGIKYLIEAFKQVDTEKKLVIAGGSSDTSEFENEMKELAKEDKRILFTGFVQGQELEELYSNAYVYVLPSDLEGMPLSLLEAMSYGNCCLVSDIPECVDVVEDKALIFQKSDFIEFREKFVILFIAVSFACIILTAVRSVLIASIIVIGYIFYRVFSRKQFIKFILYCFLLFVCIYIAYNYGLFDALLTKSKLALENGSISNGRSSILISSLYALKQGNEYVNTICGVGMTNLLKWNGININANIHAHNDFVDALVGFGLIGLGIYVYNFVKFCKNSFIWMMGTVGFLAYVNGLFVYSDIIPILIYAKLLFSHSKIQKNRIGKSL